MQSIWVSTQPTPPQMCITPEASRTGDQFGCRHCRPLARNRPESQPFWLAVLAGDGGESTCAIHERSARVAQGGHRPATLNQRATRALQVGASWSLRRRETTYAFSAQGARYLCHGARADSPPRCDRRREAALQGDGRYSDQGLQAAFADGWRIVETRRIGGGGVERCREPKRAKRATVAKNAPASRAAFAQTARGEADAPDGNLAIVEGAGRESSRRLREGKRGWRVLRHTLTSNTHAHTHYTLTHATCAQLWYNL